MEHEKSFDTVFSKWSAFVLGMGVLISPDTLVLLGNFMGKAGWKGLGLLAGTMILFFIQAANIKILNGNYNIRSSLRNWDIIQSYLLFVTRLFAAIFLATGVLVSSGFVFNEVFLYWFPNFGFAFLLLFLILGIQLAGKQIHLICQIVFVGLAITGLLGIILKGMTMTGIPDAFPPVVLPAWPVLFLPLLLWVGFELFLFTGIPPEKENRPATSVLIIAGAGILFMALGLVYIAHVPLDKLSSSTIPHLKTARILMGDIGRYIMGTIIISGSLAAVNALFSAGRIQAERMAQQGFLPQWTGKTFAIPTLLTIVIGLMMAGGVAGSEKLEIWIRSIFILWLFSYGLNQTRGLKNRFSFSRLLGLIITLCGVFSLLMTGENWTLQFTYFSFALGVGLVPGVIFIFNTLYLNPSKS